MLPIPLYSTLAYDTTSQLGLISHRKTTLLVDFSLVAPTSFEFKSKVMVMGDLASSEVSRTQSQTGNECSQDPPL